MDSQNGDYLPNAEIQITHIETGKTYSQTTGFGGNAYFTNLLPGAYKLQEILSPTGYILNSENYTINVPKASDTTFILKNEAKPGLRIIKYDSQEMIRLSDTTFEVYKDTVLIGTYTTDVLGEITLYNLEPGTYLVKEINTVDSHIVNSSPQQIELKPGQNKISELIFFNALKPGISLTKVDNVNMTPIPNVKFLISKVGGSYSEEFITDKNGEINLSQLEVGSYIVKEILTNDNYLIDDDTRVIQINPNENAHFIFTNTLKPSLSIIKTSTKNNTYIGGATFRINKLEDGSHYLDRITDINGQIKIDYLEPGIYSVKEISAP